MNINNNFQMFLVENYNNCIVKQKGNNEYVVKTIEGLNFAYLVEDDKVLINEIYVFDEVKNSRLCSNFIEKLKSTTLSIFIIDIVSSSLEKIVAKCGYHPITINKLYNLELTRGVYIKHPNAEIKYSEYEEDALESNEL